MPGYGTKREFDWTRLPCRSCLLGIVLVAVFTSYGEGVLAQTPASPRSSSDQGDPPKTSKSSGSGGSSKGDDDGSAAAASATDGGDATTMFRHPFSDRIWISGQVNAIEQWHSPFPAKYSGANSLQPVRENAMSRIFTLYMGVRLSKTTEVVCDVEEANGHGISEALGLGGVTNVDVVRNTTLSHLPYLARLLVRQIIPLSSDEVEAEGTPLSFARTLPARRLEVRAGKFSMPDFIDSNSIGSDSHLQFMNWTVVNNGAWDYAADTRGYTWGAGLEFHCPGYAVRLIEALMPKIANGIDLEWNLRRARAENIEVEFDSNRIRHRPGALK